MSHRWLIIFLWFFFLVGNSFSGSFVTSNCTNSFGSAKKFRVSRSSLPSKVQYNSTNSYGSCLQHKAQERQKKFHQSQIKKFELGGALNLRDKSQVTSVLKQWNSKLLLAQNACSDDQVARLKNRSAALEQTIASNYAVEDYSALDFSFFACVDDTYDAWPCLYGTKLDKVLHEELCATRMEAHDLALKHHANIHVKTMVPLIYEYTAQAKCERDIERAFSLSDVAHDLVTILKHGIARVTHDIKAATSCTVHGIQALAFGAGHGIQEFATREHLKQMLVAPIKFVGFMGRGLVDQELLDDAVHNFDAKKVDELFTKMEKDNKQGCDLFKAHLYATYDHIKGLSWEEFLDQGATLGTVLLLDCITLNAVGAAAHVASRVIISEVAMVFREGIATEYALEVAGAGKVALEKGEGVVLKADGIIEGTLKGEVEASSKISLLKYGMSKEKFFNFTEKELKKIMDHIFSDDHIKKGIMNLGKDEGEILNLIKNIVYDLNTKCMLKVGDNQIHTIINGCKVEIKVFLKPEGSVYMLDAFISNFARKYENCIELF